MISKEKLLNGYIENDKGEFRRLFVESAIFYGYKISFDKGIDWLDYETLYTDERTMDIVTGRRPFKNNKLTIEDFVNIDCKPEITKTLIPSDKECRWDTSFLGINRGNRITPEDIQGLRDTPQDDIFQQMLTLAEQNSMFIQFDGFTQDENNAIVVTKQGGDVEYVVETQEQFNQLVESFSVLEKFKRS